MNSVLENRVHASVLRSGAIKRSSATSTRRPSGSDDLFLGVIRHPEGFSCTGWPGHPSSGIGHPVLSTRVSAHCADDHGTVGKRCKRVDPRPMSSPERPLGAVQTGRLRC